MSCGSIESGTIVARAAEQVTLHSQHIADQATRRMHASSHYLLRTIECGYDAGVLRLKGRVPTFYLKQLVQSLVENIDGVERIDNQVDVVNPRGLSNTRS